MGHSSKRSQLSRLHSLRPNTVLILLLVILVVVVVVVVQLQLSLGLHRPNLHPLHQHLLVVVVVAQV